jgi:hypothetical protein
LVPVVTAYETASVCLGCRVFSAQCSAKSDEPLYRVWIAVRPTLERIFTQMKDGSAATGKIPSCRRHRNSRAKAKG